MKIAVVTPTMDCNV